MSQEQQQIQIKAHFERFPATVKGAFVIRCVDGDPHQVIIRGANVRSVGGGQLHPIDIHPVTLQAAPRADLFVPFEFGVMELGSGWYALECDVDVDGRSRTMTMDRGFAVPWSRSVVRRGAIPVGEKLSIADGPVVKVDHIDCGGDSVTVHFSSDEAVEVTLTADGEALPSLDSDFDGESGQGTARAYPLLKSHVMIAIEVSANGRGSASLELRLP